VIDIDQPQGETAEQIKPKLALTARDGKSERRDGRRR
jgi:hypothetical protein